MDDGYSVRRTCTRPRGYSTSTVHPMVAPPTSLVVVVPEYEGTEICGVRAQRVLRNGHLCV